MEVILYKNISENNVIGKTLNAVETLDCKLKDSVSVQSPILILTYNNLSFNKINYCYIPKFDRYYFIEEIIPIIGDRYIIKCRVDVLESFKNDILSLECIVDKQENYVASNKYINDGSMVTTSKQFNRMIEFPNGFNESGEYILITAGGGLDS